MEVVHPRCAGLDVHKKSVVACVMVPGRKEVRTFGTVTDELLRLADWLEQEQVSHVAMESTGVYWKPIYNVLESTGVERLAEMGKSQLRNKREELKLALRGSFGEHQRFMLNKQLGLLEFLDVQIAELNQEVERRLRPFETLLERMQAIPGIGPRNSEQILVEVGTDMSRFPSDAHFASWAKLCPGSDQSAGKRISGRTGQGSRWLRATMVEAAWSAARVNNSYFAAQYHRLVPRRGKRRAAVAVAHSMLIVIYHLIKDGTIYQDLGPRHFDELDRNRATHRAVHRLESLGFEVSLREVGA